MSEIIYQPEFNREREPDPKEISTLIVLGKNKGMVRGGPKQNRDSDMLSLESKMAALAAGQLYFESEGNINRIILSGGKTSGPEFNSEAQSMANYMQRIYKDKIPADVLVLEENATDTGSSALELKKLVTPILVEEPTGKIGLLTSASHKQRASSHISKQGIEFKNFIIEEVFKRMHPRYQKFIQDYENSPLTNIDNIKEAVGRTMEKTNLGKKVLNHLSKGRYKAD